MPSLDEVEDVGHRVGGLALQWSYRLLSAGLKKARLNAARISRREPPQKKAAASAGLSRRRRLFPDRQVLIIDRGGGDAFWRELRLPGLARSDVVPVPQAVGDDLFSRGSRDTRRSASSRRSAVQAANGRRTRILLPCGDDERAAPFRGVAETFGENHVFGRNVRHHSVFQLCLAHVVEDFCVKLGEVEVIPDGAGPQVCYAPASRVSRGAGSLS